MCLYLKERYMPVKNKNESEVGLVQDCCRLGLRQFICKYYSLVSDVKVEV